MRAHTIGLPERAFAKDYDGDGVHLHVVAAKALRQAGRGNMCFPSQTAWKTTAFASPKSAPHAVPVGERITIPLALAVPTRSCRAS